MSSLLNNNFRAILGALLFVCVLFAPPYVAAVFALALALRWRAWEVVLAGIFADLLWLPASVSFTSAETLPLVTLVSIILVVCLEPLRRQLLVGETGGL